MTYTVGKMIVPIEAIIMLIAANEPREGRRSREKIVSHTCPQSTSSARAAKANAKPPPSYSAAPIGGEQSMPAVRKRVTAREGERCGLAMTGYSTPPLQVEGL